MNINVSIIDQQVRGLAHRLKTQIEDALGKTLDEPMTRSVAFVLLCAKTMLDLTDEEALDTLTEGGNDFGVDAIKVDDLVDGVFIVTLFQGKYHHENLEGVKGFPQSGVEKAIQAVRTLFDPSAPLHLNPRLQIRIEEIRSLLLDGNTPKIRFLLCSNGAAWKQPEVQAIIDRERFGEQATFEHVNHNRILHILNTTQPVKETIKFTGRSLTEDIHYVRVFIGKVSVSELARIMDAHGDRLLDRNIRRYLGLHGNRVNEAIQHTLLDEHERPNFFFYNNGITLICDRFDFNALQREDHTVRVEGLQIINGGQTSKTIQTTLTQLRSQPNAPLLEDTHVLVRLYQVPHEQGPSVQTITYAVNSQNPVDLKDLRSSDILQRKLELSMKDLGFDYKRQRSDISTGPKDISVGIAAEAILSVWRMQPHKAKFRQGELFDKSYHKIFTDQLTSAQIVTAVLLFRIAENKRRRPPADAPTFIQYASHFISMLMGQKLLQDMGIPLNKLDHRTFTHAHDLIDSRGEAYFKAATDTLALALQRLYGDQLPNLSLQRLAATFRRGDLFTVLDASLQTTHR